MATPTTKSKSSLFQIFLYLIFCFFLSIPQIAIAENKNSNADLREIESKLKAEKEKQKNIEAILKDVSEDVDTLKKTLISTTEDVQKFEDSTSKLENKMSGLELEKSKLLVSLNADREKLAALITALERIRRLPPEALIAKPNAPLETAQASIILKSIIPVLNSETQKIREQLKLLDHVETSLIENRTELNRQAQKLSQEKEKLEALLALRQKAVTESQEDLKAQTKTIAKLSEEARDLRELIRKIEAKKKREKELAEKRKAERKKKAEQAKKRNETNEQRKKREAEDEREEKREAKQLAALPPFGNARLPLNGTIKTRYGEKDDIGATSEGLRIQGRAGAVVVAPLGGVIRYAGPFKKYGTIILLEHKNNYMSLIAGLERIDTVEGQRVDAGEPLGKMGGSSAPTLYYELRFKGDPVNPASQLKI